MEQLENLNVVAQELLVTPAQLKAELPVSDPVRHSVHEAREQVRNILNGSDHRLLIVVGPCSIHDVVAAEDYARRLKALADELAPDSADRHARVLREAAHHHRLERTRQRSLSQRYVPHRGRDSNRAQAAARIAELGVPLSTEALDPISPQYLHELIAWSAIGARTTESQTHREMASGLSSAVGFKNGTDGSLDVAINALQSVSKPHRFLGINQSGQVSIIHTRGNLAAHVVLRGGHAGPNYDRASVAECERALAAAGLTSNIMIDCSHANSGKDPLRQMDVARDAAAQIQAGNRSIMGLMIESNINAGNQKLTRGSASARLRSIRYRSVYGLGDYCGAAA